MNTPTRVRWLRAAAAITGGFGVLIAMAASPALQAPAALLMDLVFLPLDGRPLIDGPAARLLCAVAGGVLVGWGVMIWLVASRVCPERPQLGRRIMLAAIGSWFVVDSAMSVAAGAWFNVALNAGFLLMFAVPVLAPGDASEATAGQGARRRQSVTGAGR